MKTEYDLSTMKFRKNPYATKLKSQSQQTLMYVSGFLYVLGCLYIIAVHNTVTMNDMLVFAPGILVQLISLFFAKRLNGK